MAGSLSPKQWQACQVFIQNLPDHSNFTAHVTPQSNKGTLRAFSRAQVYQLNKILSKINKVYSFNKAEQNTDKLKHKETFCSFVDGYFSMYQVEIMRQPHICFSSTGAAIQSLNQKIQVKNIKHFQKSIAIPVCFYTLSSNMKIRFKKIQHWDIME